MTDFYTTMHRTCAIIEFIYYYDSQFNFNGMYDSDKRIIMILQGIIAHQKIESAYYNNEVSRRRNQHHGIYMQNAK